MKQGITITVSDLGPIKDPCTVELNNFMVFSGKSGIGKSYLAMLVHYAYLAILGGEFLRFLEYKNVDYAKLRKEIPNEAEVKICEIQSCEMIDWLNVDAVEYIRRITGNPNLSPKVSFRFEDLPERFTFYSYRTAIPSSRGKDDAETIEYVRLKESGEKLDIHISFAAMGNVSMIVLMNRFLRQRYGIRPINNFFLPPSRGGILTLPSSAIFDNRDSMGMYYEFLSGFERLKAFKYGDFGLPDDDKDSVMMKEHLHDKVLNGEVVVDDNNMLLYKMKREGGASIPISAAASSIKELAPLALIVEKERISNYSILFEEPESHLHPELQVAVVDLMAAMMTAGTHFQITTHSDYILRRINDLIYLFMIKRKLGDEGFKNFCREQEIGPVPLLNPLLVNAYYLKTGEDGHTVVSKQDLSNGIPFDTFEEVIKTSIFKSSDIYEKFMSLQNENAD